MLTITKSISVDVSAENTFQSIIAKQYDTNSRFLKIQLKNENEPIRIDSSCSVQINASREDNTAKAFSGIVNDDGTVTVPISNWMLELDGEVRCDISVIDNVGNKLTSTVFLLQVDAATYGGDSISEDANYDLLTRLIEEFNTTLENANSSADKAQQTADEAKAIAQGKATSLTFDTKEQLDEWIAGAYTRSDGKTTADLKIGDNLYIVELGVPDYWWDGSTVQPLGAEKPNLADYYTVDRINEKIGSCIFGQMSEAEYDAACQGTGGDKMIRIKARSQFVSIYIPDLQANTDYTISFSYYNPKRYEGLNYIIDYMGIFAPDVANASIRYQRNGYLNFVSHFDSYTSSDGVFANRTIDTRTTNGIEEKTWNHVELKFNSGEFTNIALVILPAVNEILLNDFVFAPDYFENASNWQINSSDSTQIGASGIPAPAWALLTESTNTSLDAGRIYFVY